MISRIRMLLLESMGLKTISKQEAIDGEMFGPVYHGTLEQNFENIKEKGFSVRIGETGSEGISHGYQQGSYGGYLPPVHHLGFGIYFTTVKNIAKGFAYGNTKVLKEYYLDVPQLETINFGSENTMMKWWIKMGYPAKDIYEGTLSRLEGTKILTDNLKSRYDAVWFKGKGIGRLLDGDQICVFDPSKIYLVDTSKYNDFDTGSKVKMVGTGMIGVIMGKSGFGDEFVEMRRQWISKYKDMIDKIENGDDTPIKEWNRYKDREITPEVRKEALSSLKYDLQGMEGMFRENDFYQYIVKWNKGGTDYGVLRGNIEPYRGRTKS